MFSELHFTAGVLFLINFIVSKSKVVVGAQLLEKKLFYLSFFRSTYR